MDAATLYIVLTLPNGGQKASIIGEPTWAACRQHIAFLQELKRMDPDAPIVRYRCMFKMPFNCKFASRGTAGGATATRSRLGKAAQRFGGSPTCGAGSS